MRLLSWLMLLVAAAGPLGAQTTSEERKPARAAPPAAAGASTTVIQGQAQGRPKGEHGPKLAADRPAPSAPSKASGTLETLKPLSMKEGEAQVLVDGVEQTIRPGSLIGKDVVKSVDPGQMVLLRPASAGYPGGEATVVVTFGEKGTSNVRVYWTKDPTAHVAPEVR